jgi:hypothetical protein
MDKPVNQKDKEGFGMQTKASYDDGTSKKGDLYSKSGKNACMSSNLKTLHNCF